MTGGSGGAKTAAFFDVDGTCVDATIVHYYVYFRRRLLPPALRPVWYGGFLFKCLYYLLLDRRDRSLFNVRFYRNYAGMSAERVRGMVDACHREVIEPRIFPHALSCISAHRSAGRRIVLLTGSLDFIVAPLAEKVRADAVIAPTMTESEGRFTGRLNGPPIGDEEKARRLTAFAEREGIDLAGSYAYADSLADLPVLEKVGHPNVVNPDGKLERIARERRWPVLRWTRPSRKGGDKP
ncbi:MAG: HAD family hydrolase [Planctomycetota bacterium]|nr:MAG: HAD family hydrolase [Planctomycetota bacterium]